MKINILSLAAFACILLLGCSKNEDQIEQKVDREINLRRAILAGKNMVRPEVPAYTGDVTAVESRGVTVVSPGVNQLQAIINNAGNNETIRLLAGTHTETNTLVINHKVKLTGDPGAILSLGGPLGLLVSNATGASVNNLKIEGTSGGWLAVGVENSDQVSIKSNHISGFDWLVILEQANHANVSNNTMVGNGFGDGVVVMNGDFATVSGNNVSNTFFGIWSCDRKGVCSNNTLQNCLVGYILCKVPVGSFPLGTGTGGAEMPGNNWKVINNSSSENVWGYLIIDGSFENTLTNNSASNNLIDMELAGDTNNLFGFFTPTSANNTVNAGSSNMTIIDCGLNNVVHGATAQSGPCSN
jgi:nitrous oxidase accessory protein NosD